MIFAYRERNYNRDCCAYFKDNVGVGDSQVSGPCFWQGFGTTYSYGQRTTIPYEDVETVLTEEEYNQVIESGVTYEIIQKLRSPEALDFEDAVMEDERLAIMEEHQLDAIDTDYVLANYPGEGYRDRGIVSCVFADWEDAAHEEAWGMGYVSDGNDRYFNYSAFAEDLQEAEGYAELPSGKVVYYSL